MKAIVTGGAGFIGSHLVHALVSKGLEVHVIDNLSTGHADRLPHQSELYQLDINDPETKNLVLHIKPHVVFHLAAQADVSTSIQLPAMDAEVNINGTIQLLEACYESGVQKFIFASTSAVYGDLQRELLSESDPTNPISFYGLSKWAAECYIRMFHHFYKLPYTILRFANVFGPGQTPKGEGGVVAIFLEKIKEELPLIIHGDGEQTRDFIYVKDVVEANIAAMSHASCRTLHVSTGTQTTINELAEKLQSIHDSRVAIVRTTHRHGDIRHSCLDPRLAKQHLNWSPQYDVLTGLTQTYRHHIK
ncbi:GDP-mannose 4,6-dehydratase [Paenibacillus sp. N1-5-1-14]|uniref:NAD-dependent epimerase/dehydratase family protein n=1 Tax=Paenibacillus radicibacter TaxID=2972488 RepID=UPI0021599CFB|nr:NAD-dependent epimerase/dehydratase family protein [Paenibacillus radicibacter]MCR8645184.1 GDP-mannose 4,6-dehydratase [Paenibacillus radicibacter]